MRVVPGTHRLPMIEHDDKPSPHNMIKRGQGISDRFDGEAGVSMPLAAGEMSLHHTALVHCSPGNDNDDRRMGLGISFIPAHVKPLGPVKPSALLVRGTDRYGHFVPEATTRHADVSRGASGACRGGAAVPPAAGSGIQSGCGISYAGGWTARPSAPPSRRSPAMRQCRSSSRRSRLNLTGSRSAASAGRRRAATSRCFASATAVPIGPSSG